MPLNRKLAVKVLKEMEIDFVYLEARLVNVQDEAKQMELFKQIQELKASANKLKLYYQKLLLQGA